MSEAKVVQLIETTERRGCGRSAGHPCGERHEHEPVRLVRQWFTLDGALLFERDAWWESAHLMKGSGR